MITVVVYGGVIEGMEKLVNESLDAVAGHSDKRGQVLSYFPECQADQTETVVMVFVGEELWHNDTLRRDFASELQARIDKRRSVNCTFVQVVLAT